MPKALVLAPDRLPLGLHTISRGEGRWTLTVIELLSIAGYEVDVIQLISAANTFDSSKFYIDEKYKDKQPKNITWRTDLQSNMIKKWSQNQTMYDVYFCHFPIHIENKPIWNDISPFIKKALIGTFWPNLVSTWETKWGTPTPSNVTPVATVESTSGVAVLPVGHIDKFRPPQFANKKIIWTCKSPFSNDRVNAKYKVNLWHLEATLAAVKLGHEVDFMCVDKNFCINKPDAPPVEEALWKRTNELLDELKTYPDLVKFYEYLPLDEYLEHIASASVAFTLDSASSLSYIPLYGVVPMVLCDWGLDFVKRTVLSRLGAQKTYEQHTKDDVINKTMRLLQDEIHYNKQLEIIRTGCAYHTTDQAVALLKAAINH